MPNLTSPLILMLTLLSLLDRICMFCSLKIHNLKMLVSQKKMKLCLTEMTRTRKNIHKATSINLSKCTCLQKYIHSEWIKLCLTSSLYYWYHFCLLSSERNNRWMAVIISCREKNHRRRMDKIWCKEVRLNLKFNCSPSS